MPDMQVTDAMMDYARRNAVLATHVVFWPSSWKGEWDCSFAYDAAEARDIAKDAGPDAVIRKLDNA